MKVKLVSLMTLLSLSSSVLGADTNTVPKLEEHKSFYEKFELKPYASALARNDVLDFTEGAVGLEAQFNVNKNVGFSVDLLGVNDTKGSLVDRLGVNLVTTLPLSKSVSLYAEGGFGYWFGDLDDFDMAFRGGSKFNFTKHIGAFADIGQGFRFKSGGSYQQVRAGIDIGF